MPAFALFPAPLLALVTARADVPVTAVQKQVDGVVLTCEPGTLRLQVISDSIVRVTYSAGATIPETKSPVQPSATPPAFTLRDLADAQVLGMPRFRVQVDRTTGAISFKSTSTDMPLLEESTDGRALGSHAQIPAHARQSFILPPDESFHLVGQAPTGDAARRGQALRLPQQRGNVPHVLASSRGYVVLWNSSAPTELAIGAPRPTPATVPGDPEGAGRDIVRWSSSSADTIDYFFTYAGDAASSMDALRAHLPAAGTQPR